MAEKTGADPVAAARKVDAAEQAVDISKAVDNATQGQQQPYLRESAVFERMVDDQRRRAMRLLDELDSETARLQAEIDQRNVRRQDLLKIITRADRALAPVPDELPEVDSVTLALTTALSQPTPMVSGSGALSSGDKDT
jgi:hypothetical protein